jgi:hypothetical protein
VRTKALRRFNHSPVHYYRRCSCNSPSIDDAVHIAEAANRPDSLRQAHRPSPWSGSWAVRYVEVKGASGAVFASPDQPTDDERTTIGPTDLLTDHQQTSDDQPRPIRRISCYVIALTRRSRARPSWTSRDVKPFVSSQPANTISSTAIGMARSIQGEPRPVSTPRMPSTP